MGHMLCVDEIEVLKINGDDDDSPFNKKHSKANHGDMLDEGGGAEQCAALV